MMSKKPRIRGFADLETYAPGAVPGVDKPVHVDSEEFDVSNLVLNMFRFLLPALLAPQIVTGRGDNTASDTTWLNRRLCLAGFGIGDGATTPSVKPEDPEDGRTMLVGETDYLNSKQGLQGPIRRVPLVPGNPSEVNTPSSPINSYYLFKEVDADGVVITQFDGGGAELRFVFTLDEDEYIGNIMEYALYFSGDDASDDSTFEVDPGENERVRLSRETAIPCARKTRASKYEKTSASKSRLVWRITT
jgi:hypothetical protein